MVFLLTETLKLFHFPRWWQPFGSFLVVIFFCGWTKTLFFFFFFPVENSDQRLILVGNMVMWQHLQWKLEWLQNIWLAVTKIYNTIFRYKTLDRVMIFVFVKNLLGLAYFLVSTCDIVYLLTNLSEFFMYLDFDQIFQCKLYSRKQLYITIIKFHCMFWTPCIRLSCFFFERQKGGKGWSA